MGAFARRTVKPPRISRSILERATGTASSQKAINPRAQSSSEFEAGSTLAKMDLLDSETPPPAPGYGHERELEMNPLVDITLHRQGSPI